MTLFVDDYLIRINSLKKRSKYISLLIVFVRALILASLVFCLWSEVRTSRNFELFLIAFVAFLLGIALSTLRRGFRIKKNELILSLEMKFPEKASPAFAEVTGNHSEIDGWKKSIEAEYEMLFNFEAQKNIRLFSTLALPTLALTILLLTSSSGLGRAISNVKRAVERLNWGASLTVIDGAVDTKATKVFKISENSLHKIELLAQNMIEIELTADQENPKSKILELRRPKSAGGEESDITEVYQTFQMSTVSSNLGEENFSSLYRIQFSVSRSVDLYLPSVSGRAVAEIIVKSLPIPEVDVSVDGKLHDPWPDDLPLPLSIKVRAENAIELVRVFITSGNQTSNELVNNVLNATTLELQTEYSLLLEPYVQSDIADVEIVVEAIDRLVPIPLVGRSKPLNLRIASAYGRYRQTLLQLRQIKESIDRSTQNDEKIADETLEISESALNQSNNSPFFDQLDRINLSRIHLAIKSQSKTYDAEELLSLSTNLDEFLFEHEILDDRERDRDFFVAVRGLSRLVEQKRELRSVQLAVVTERLVQFLDRRHKRWEVRISRLSSQNIPHAWPLVNLKRPFRESMNNIEEFDRKSANDSNALALVELTKVATEYRVWIEALEEKEDKEREEQEQKRNQGLATARNELRELQKTQGKISQRLDRADSKNTEKLADDWPATRIDQNQNLGDTKKLEAQMRSLAPLAAKRIKAAWESMELTIQSGNVKEFIDAESASDLAGRLLRQAENAAQQSQKQQGQRGRRRRVTGDKYYGQSVVGGEIEFKREYQVDRRYREDILNEVQESLNNQSNGDDAENRKVLENYLRKVVR